MPTDHPPPTCQYCQVPMVLGFQLDATHGGNTLPKWVAGEPQRSIWVGIKAAQVATAIPVTTYRCPDCGYLESYAR